MPGSLTNPVNLTLDLRLCKHDKIFRLSKSVAANTESDKFKKFQNHWKNQNSAGQTPIELSEKYNAYLFWESDRETATALWVRRFDDANVERTVWLELQNINQYRSANQKWQSAFAEYSNQAYAI